MKKFILLLFVLFAVFVLVNRQKLFVRDPLGNVARDGVKENGAQVYINYSNEVMIENDNEPSYRTMVQANNHIGTPVTLKCIHWMACLTDADPANVITPFKRLQVQQMTNELVEFRDEQGRDVLVTLR